MPPRARPADPARLEAALSPAARAFLDEARRTCSLGGNWQAAEGLQAVVTHITALQLAARYLEAGMASDGDDALNLAAAHLGVSAFTIRTRQARWFIDSRTLTKSHNTSRR